MSSVSSSSRLPLQRRQLAALVVAFVGEGLPACRQFCHTNRTAAGTSRTDSPDLQLTFFFFKKNKGTKDKKNFKKEKVYIVEHLLQS